MNKINEIHNIKLTDKSFLLYNYYFSINKYFFNIKTKTISKVKSIYINFQKTLYKNFNEIYSNIKQQFHEYNYEKYRKTYLSDSHQYKDMIAQVYERHMINNKYITNEVKKFIKSDHSNKSYLLSYNIPLLLLKYTTTININFILYNKQKADKTDINIYDKYVTHIIAIIELICKLSISKNKCSRDGINITVFLTPYKKEINYSKPFILGPSHANSGFCYGCISRGEIVIYREEEFVKVIIHELLHNFGIDIYIWNFIKNVYNHSEKEYNLYNKFISHFNLNKNINDELYDIGLQECYIEFFAEFLNVALFSYNHSITCSPYNNNMFSIYINNFETLMEYEKIHSLMQFVKILKYNNISLSDISSDIKKKYNNYHETTHVFSYYLIKCLLIFDYDSFLNSWLLINNISDKNKISIIFNSSCETMEGFLNNILKIFFSKAFIENYKVMDYIYEYIYEYINKKGSELIIKKDFKLLLSNLRMTLIEYK